MSVSGRPVAAVPVAGATHRAALGNRRRGPRHGHRHPAGPHRPAVPIVQPGGRLDLATVRRDGPRTRDQQAPGRAAGWHDHRREQRRAGRGQPLRRADRRARGARRRGQRSRAAALERAPRQGRADRRRQRHEPADPDCPAPPVGDDRPRNRLAGRGDRLGARWGARRCRARRPVDARHGRAGIGGRPRRPDGPGPPAGDRRVFARRPGGRPGERRWLAHEAGEAVTAPRRPPRRPRGRGRGRRARTARVARDPARPTATRCASCSPRTTR